MGQGEGHGKDAEMGFHLQAEWGARKAQLVAAGAWTEWTAEYSRTMGGVTESEHAKVSGGKANNLREEFYPVCYLP